MEEELLEEVLVFASPDHNKAKLYSLMGIFKEKGITAHFSCNLVSKPIKAKAVLLSSKLEKSCRDIWEKYQTNGGYIHVSEVLEDDTFYDNYAIMRIVEIICFNADVKSDFSALLDAGKNVEDLKLLEQMGRELLENSGDISIRSGWNDSIAYNYWRVLEAGEDFFADPVYGKILNENIDYLIKKTNNNVINTDYLAGLRFVLHRCEKTGNHSDVDYVKARVDKVLNTFPRINGAIVHCPGRDTYVWNEVCAMLCPTAACLGRILDDSQYIEAAVRQIRITQSMNMGESGLWHHAGRPDKTSPVVWGRGMAWALEGVCCTLEELPEDNKFRIELITMLNNMLEAVLKTRSEYGFWRNVLTVDYSRPESSCTCFFTRVMAYAFNVGWIKSDIFKREIINRSWESIKSLFLFDNRLLSFCVGTPATNSLQFYISRPHRDFMIGPTLSAGMEIFRMNSKEQDFLSPSSHNS